MAGFERKGNTLQLLTDEEVERIHLASLEVLEGTGMVVRDGETLQLLEGAGCQVDLNRGLAKIPRRLVEQAIEQGPPVVSLCGRSEEHDLHLGDGKVYARTPGGVTRVLGLEDGVARDATRHDVAGCARVADALPNVHGVSMFQVVTNAEVLGLITFAQLACPHTPVVYGMSSSVPDMRTGLNLAGAVEIGLLGAAVAQLAGRYDLPCSMTSGIDARSPGAQATLERLMTALPPILAGMDMINLSTTDTKLTFSLEQLVIDDEIMRWIARYLSGIRVDDETLALELIHEVGPRGTFVGEKHTVEHFREELLVKGLIRGPWENGKEHLEAKARHKAREILIEHRPRPLGEALVGQLAEIVREATERPGVMGQ